MTGQLVFLGVIVVAVATTYTAVSNLDIEEFRRDLGLPAEPALAQPTAAAESATPQPSPAPTATAAPAVPAPENRADCGAIRGTSYRSSEERSWFLSHCVAGANRADCDEIRGTQYLSSAERAWYLATCT